MSRPPAPRASAAAGAGVGDGTGEKARKAAWSNGNALLPLASPMGTASTAEHGAQISPASGGKGLTPMGTWVDCWVRLGTPFGRIHAACRLRTSPRAVRV